MTDYRQAAQDVAPLLAAMSACWPSPAPSDETLVLWTDRLRRYSRTVAHEIVTTLIAEQKRWPSIADLQAAARIIAERHRTEADRRGLPAPPCAICENGWVEIEGEDGRVSSYRYCPNGCPITKPGHPQKPPAPPEVARQWIEEARAAMKGGGPLTESLDEVF